MVDRVAKELFQVFSEVRVCICMLYRGHRLEPGDKIDVACPRVELVTSRLLGRGMPAPERLLLWSSGVIFRRRYDPPIKGHDQGLPESGHHVK